MLLILALLAGCSTAEQRALDAARRQGELNAQLFPPYPDDCRKRERSGVRMGERLDVALIRTDQALGRANARISRCAAWYDGISIEGN